MTNREKFKEVYGFELDGNPCAAPQSICNEQTCERCPFWGWWDKEYKSCFRYEKPKKAMTRTEAELAIVEKIKEIKDIALKYDQNIESLSMAVRHYDGTEEYFDNEWVINFHADNHSLDAFVQGGEVYSGRVGSAGEIIAEGVTV
jgi:hypothetical protein